MPIPDETLLAIWDQALAEEIGIAVDVEGNRDVFRNQLYEARKRAENPEHQKIIVFVPTEPRSEVWLVKKATELD